MDSDKKAYRFINSKTGYAIAYLSLPVDMGKDAMVSALETRRKELAVEHKIFVETIYWEAEER